MAFRFSFLMLAFLGILLPAGCIPEPHGNGGDDDDASDDDDATADDDDATADDDDDATADDDDSTADDDDATADDDDATADDDDSVPAPEDLFGGVSIGYYTGDFGVAYEAFYASAGFLSVKGGTGTGWDEVVDPQEGMDDCGLYRSDASGGGDAEYYDLGAVNVSSPEWEIQMLPSHSGGTISYYLDLSAEGFDPDFGRAYSFEAEGGDLAGFSAANVVTLPMEMAVSSPDLGYLEELPSGAVAFSWEEEGAESVSITLFAYDAGSGDTLFIDCRAEDDGSFTVPASLRNALPGGVSVSVGVGRSDLAYVPLGGSGYITAYAFSSIYGSLVAE